MEKTPIQELIKECEGNYLMPSGWREKYLEKEKQMVIDAYRTGDDVFNYYSESDAERYYEDKYNTK